jgi:threonine/homoserine/homoserine lactone efflux protein
MSSHILAAVGQGVLIGLGAAVPIGQVNVMIARRTLRGGFWPGFAVGAGASSIDVMYAMLSSLGFGAVLASPRVSRFKSGAWMRLADIAGGLTLLAFAVRTFLRSMGLIL